MFLQVSSFLPYSQSYQPSIMPPRSIPAENVQEVLTLDDITSQIKSWFSSLCAERQNLANVADSERRGVVQARKGPEGHFWTIRERIDSSCFYRL
jgi:hypothetical protein